MGYVQPLQAKFLIEIYTFLLYLMSFFPTIERFNKNVISISKHGVCTTITSEIQ